MKQAFISMLMGKPVVNVVYSTDDFLLAGIS